MLYGIMQKIFADYIVKLNNGSSIIKEEKKMSTPEGHKDLWKNCTWKNESEKRAFYNHYFKDSVFVKETIKDNLDSLKNSLKNFVEDGTIQDGNNKRKITNQDILKRITE